MAAAASSLAGRATSAPAVLNVSGADTLITSGDDFQLGRIGTGTLNQSGGEIEGGFTVVGKFGTGIWNHSGGLFRARNQFEIGDGGTPDQAGTAGPREGVINLTGGVMHTNSRVAIGNRAGTGTVNVSGGILAATGSGDGEIFVGRGDNWGGLSGQGGPVALRVTGSEGTVIANGNLDMNTSDVASSSTIIAEITGSSHTTIKVGGDALISNGSLAVELTGYSPVQGDSWTLIEAGADLSAEKQAIDDFITLNEFTPVNHVDPSFLGIIVGEFASLSLPEDFAVEYTTNQVILNYTGSGVCPGRLRQERSG